ncbi:MAG: hypothetical protein WAN35_04015 [Terracidiphilus sp.]
MTKFAISDEMKNKQREMLLRTRFSRLALLLLVMCVSFFIQDREPFRSHIWILFSASGVGGIISWVFIEWIDSKKQASLSGTSSTAQK